jgi:long-chain acyl-CoA synthetase
MATTSSAPAPTASPAGDAGTIPASFLAATATRSGTAVRHFADGEWRDVSFAELGERARALAAGLIGMGIEPGDRVAILADTRMEWTVADLAALLAGAVVVPVYQTSSPEEVEYVLAHSGARLLFADGPEQLAKLDDARERLPDLEAVVAFEGAGDAVFSLDAVRTAGAAVTAEEVEARARSVRPDDLCTIVYTSGTTGPPKGCMLTHANLRVDGAMVQGRLPLGPGDVLFAFLPLAHVLTRGVQFLALDSGATLAFWRGDMTKVLDDIAAVRPTHLPSVPRVFEKIHARALRSAEGSPLKRALFHRAVATGRRVRELEAAGRRPGRALALRHRLADRLVLSKVRALFGGRLELALTGAAPISPEVLRFFDACGVTVLEGYGMTETAAVATVNTPSERRLGTVGRPLEGCEVRIADDGEVLMRGPNVFAGYYRDDAATEATLRDGWLHSGDLGALDADGFLRITGRKKDLIITSSGKNISPANIEDALRQSPWIGQAVVVGDRRPYLVALLTLDAQEAPEQARLAGIDAGDDPAALARDPRIRQVVQGIVDEANRRFARIEQVKRFAILPRELDQANGELTPTQKIRRRAVLENHAATVEELYRPA